MTPTEERAAIEAAWRERNPEITAGTWDAVYDWQDDYDRFHAMLDAGAHLDAVLTMVPEGWLWRIMPGDFEGWLAELWQPGFGNDTEFAGRGHTPALALLAAIQKIGEQG